MRPASPSEAPEEPMDADALQRALEEHMDAIMELMEAIANEAPDTDIKLAELLEGANEQVRIAIVEKLRALLRTRAAEKEKELDQYMDQEKRQVVERQRNIFMQWLAWLMSEETLRKIREAFIARPGLERQVISIGEELAAKGLIDKQVQLAEKQQLGELHANVARTQEAGLGKDTGKGR